MNVGILNSSAYLGLVNYDAAMVGTDRYLGIAYFWAYAYRYPMRDLSCVARRRVHALMLERGLAPDGRSAAHAQAINDALPSNTRRGLEKVYGKWEGVAP